MRCHQGREEVRERRAPGPGASMLRFVTVRCVNVNSTEALLRVLVAACVCRRHDAHSAELGTACLTDKRALSAQFLYNTWHSVPSAAPGTSYSMALSAQCTSSVAKRKALQCPSAPVPCRNGHRKSNLNLENDKSRMKAGLVSDIRLIIASERLSE